MNVKIVNRWDPSKVLFECDAPEDIAIGMRMRHALERATAARADLRGAYLRGADLSGAYLSGAYLRGGDAATPAQSVENLDRVRAIILDNAKRLDMSHWHEDGGWEDRTCAEETLCETTHCLAGWLQVCATDPKIRELDTQTAGIMCAPVSAKMFFRGSEEVLDWLRDRKYVADLDEIEKRAAERAAKVRA